MEIKPLQFYYIYISLLRDKIYLFCKNFSKSISFTLDNMNSTLWLCLLLAKFCKNEQLAKSKMSTLLLCLLHTENRYFSIIS